MSLLNEQFVETFELELIGSNGRYAYVYWPQALNIPVNSFRAEALAHSILRAFLRTPIAAFPGAFLNQFQDIIMNEGWWIMFDEKLYKLPIMREYFEITRFYEMNMPSNQVAFSVRWGEEEICQIMIPFDLFPEFESFKVKSKYYAAQS